MASRYMKRCSTSLIIKEVQIKITMRYQLIPVMDVYYKKTEVNKCLQDVEKSKHLYTTGGNVN